MEEFWFGKSPDVKENTSSGGAKESIISGQLGEKKSF
jgi:hypothetical protein